MKKTVRNLLPWAAMGLSVLSLFGNGYPAWVQYFAIGIASVIVLGWLISETGWLGRAIKLRFFPNKLTKDQRIRLAVFLDEINNVLSYSYTYSPFYVWHSNLNKPNQQIRMDYAHHNAIFTWIVDIRDTLAQPKVNALYVIPSLSKALSEATKLGEKAERDLQELYLNSDLNDSDKRRLKKDWDSAKTRFNSWINSFSALSKEINKSIASSCVHYFRPLGIIE
jgi:hypothetical protein